MCKNLISVIIPVYNVEEYLQDCIESVLNQTYKNIEIVAINDGSTDDSLKILESYANVNENIIIISQENSGQSAARNKGINIASGKYIYFLDADDYILPETFEQIIKTMEENNLDIIRFAAEPFIDKLDMKLESNKYDLGNFFQPDKIYYKEEFLEKTTIKFLPSPVLYIIKKKLLTDNNILFKPNIIVHEDELFTLEVFLNASAMIYKSNYYYKRRYRPNSTMTTDSLDAKKKSFNSSCAILNYLIRLKLIYKNKPELKLINKRIRVTTVTLINKYRDIDKDYRKKKIKSIENLSQTYYFYHTFRQSIKRFYFNRVKEKL